MATAKFLRRTPDGKVISDAHLLEVRIPREYFDDGLAEIVGDKLKTIGIFGMSVTPSETAKPVEYVMNVPNPIVLSYSSEHVLRVEGSSEDEDDEDSSESFRVFVIEKGGVFMESESIVIGADNVESFVKLLHSGKLPKTSYENIYRLYMAVQQSNKTSVGVSSATLEAIIAELCRHKKDRSVPFRMALRKAGVTDSDYEMVSLKILPELISAFSGISFENVNRALATSINNKRKGKVDRITPMEQIIRG